MRVSFPKSSYNFYPRPPRGGRPCSYSRITKGVLFLSTPSARRATSGPLNERSNRIYFYPRPPRGGRPVLFMELLVILHISIHALREEGDAFSAGASCFCAISIHALREEGDLPGLFLTLLILLFLSTPSARRATLSQGRFLAEESISIHALREEGDRVRSSQHRAAQNFYPRPPRGGRRTTPLRSNTHSGFLSTPSARRATYVDAADNALKVFLSTPSARRATRLLLSVSWKVEFLSTPSARRATCLPVFFG